MLMSLDQFVFGLSTLAYSELQRQSSWKHRNTSRVGARDARQFVGPGDDTITLNGMLAPQQIGSLASLDELRAMAAPGAAYVLVDGGGKVYGAYVIESINETQTLHNQDGTPLKIDFTICLTQVDDQLMQG
jgi:phage protein U